MANNKNQKSTGKPATKKPVISINQLIKFESAAVAKLPLGKIYLRVTPDGIRDIYQVVITRQNSDTHISFAIFFINGLLGEIMEVEFDYNCPIKDLKDYLSLFNEQDTQELPTLIRLIEDGALVTYIFEKKLPDHYHEAKNIIPGPEELAVISNKAPELLAEFQKRRFSNPSTRDDDYFYSGHFGIFDKLDDLLPLKYTRDNYSKWTVAEWNQFLDGGLDTYNITETFNIKLLPSIYFFEKVLYPGLKIAPDIDKALDRLAESQPAFAPDLERSLGALKSYKVSDREFLFQNIIREILTSSEFDDDTNRIILFLNDLVAQYPKNPFIKDLLLEAMIGADMILRLEHHAYGAYSMHQDNPALLLRFLEALALKSFLAEPVFGKGILLEDHTGPELPIFEPHFHRYYLYLAAWLSHKGQFKALWKLYTIISRFPLFKSSDLLQQRWLQMLMAIPGEVIPLWHKSSQAEMEAYLAKLTTK